jgi:peptidoglycan/LPS O-acetylase OafA/YrhL
MQALGNLALLQGFFVLGIAAVNPVTWSLSYEAAFYVAIPALAAAWRLRGHPPGNAALAVAFTAIVAIAAFLPPAKAIYFAYFALFVPGIALGRLAAADRERLARTVPLPAVLAAWIAFTLAVKLEAIANSGPAYYAASATAGGLLVLKACDSAGLLARWLRSPGPRWLGRYSYSFFLIHYIVVHGWGAIVASAIPRGSPVAYSIAFLAGSFGLSLLASRLLYAVTERFYFRES